MESKEVNELSELGLDTKILNYAVEWEYYKISADIFISNIRKAFQDAGYIKTVSNPDLEKKIIESLVRSRNTGRHLGMVIERKRLTEDILSLLSQPQKESADEKVLTLALKQEREKVEQSHIDAINDCTEGKISFEKCTDILNINPHELKAFCLKFGDVL